MLSPEIEEKIRVFVADFAPDVYIVSMLMDFGAKNAIRVKVDTDAGIKMEEISTLNRALGRWLAEQDLIEGDYGMEVSSPGVGAPLVLHRQYAKEMGRILRAIRLDGTEAVGFLSDVTETYIALTPEKKKAKDPDPEPLIVPFTDIKEAKVLLPF